MVISSATAHQAGSVGAGLGLHLGEGRNGRRGISRGQIVVFMAKGLVLLLRK